MKKGYLPILEFQPEGQAPVCHTPKGFGGAFQECRSGDTSCVHTIPRSHYSSLAPPKNGLKHLPEAPSFTTVIQGTPLDHLVWRSVGFMTMGPQEHIYWQTLKAVVCGIGSQSAWNQKLTESLPSGMLKDLGTPSHPQQLGPTKNKSGHLDNQKGLRKKQDLGQGWKISFIYTRQVLPVTEVVVSLITQKHREAS